MLLSAGIATARSFFAAPLAAVAMLRVMNEGDIAGNPRGRMAVTRCAAMMMETTGRLGE